MIVRAFAANSPRLRACAARACWILLALAGTTQAYLAWCRRPMAVVEGSAYRSSQPSNEELARLSADKRLRSVLSLCGERSTSELGELGVAEWCARNGLEHRRVRLRADQQPTARQAQELLRALDELPRPILIHCKAGADRTGLAATVYMVTQQGQDLEQALSEQLTTTKGHWSIGEARAMDEWFERYRAEADGRSLREWILGLGGGPSFAAGRTDGAEVAEP